MKAFETLDRFTTADGQELTFHRRDGDYFVYLDGDELMSTRAPGSEKALAEIACGALSGRPRVLIGGLGLGFTLRSALDILPSGAKVVVAEVFDCVISWNRIYLSDLQGDALTDRRTRIEHADVWDLVRTQGPWDAILLDVDNGPTAWCLASNRRLYDQPGLLQLKAALASNGLIAFWSAHPDPRFVKTLRKCGFDARSHSVRAHGGRGAKHAVFVARI